MPKEQRNVGWTVDISKLISVGEGHVEDSILHDDLRLKAAAGLFRSSKSVLGDVISALQADMAVFMLKACPADDLLKYRMAYEALDNLWERFVSYELEDDKRTASKKKEAEGEAVEESAI